MELNIMLELLTHGAGLDSNLAPVMHENSKLWPYQTSFLKPAVREEYLPAHERLAEITPGIDLNRISSTTKLPESSFEKPVSLKVVARLLSSMSATDKNVIDKDFVRGISLRSYLLAWRIQELNPGSYFYWPRGEKLIPVRNLTGNSFEERLVLNPASLRGSAGLIVLCGTISYDGQGGGERYYRNLLLMAGCLANNVIRSAYDLGLEAGIIAGFLDDPLGLELGVDPAYEQPLVAIAFSHRVTKPSREADYEYA
jgi:hypothetical protein